MSFNLANYDGKKGSEEAAKKEKEAKKKDYYKILGLSKDAGENDIRKAYKKLAVKWHPDKNTESEEKRAVAEKTFKDINEAYAVLSDPKKRQMFDSGVDPNDPESGGHGFGNADVHDVFNMFFQGGNGFGGGDDFPGFFSFGGGSGGQRTRGGQTFTFKFG